MRSKEQMFLGLSSGESGWKGIGECYGLGAGLAEVLFCEALRPPMFDSAWCLATWALTSAIDWRLSGWLESSTWRARTLLDGGMTFLVNMEWWADEVEVGVETTPENESGKFTIPLNDQNLVVFTSELPFLRHGAYCFEIPPTKQPRLVCPA